MREVYISTACLKGEKSYERVLGKFLKNGIKNIELTGVHPHTNLKKLENIIKRYQKKGIKFTFHNYFPPPKRPIVLNFLTNQKSQKKLSKGVISRSTFLAKKTGVPVYAFHPGYLREANINKKGYFDFYGSKKISKRAALDKFIKDFSLFYKNLKIDKKKQKYFLGIENLFPNPDGTNDSFMCTFEEINKIFTSKKFKDTNLCLLIDLGHLAIAANILKFNRYKFLEKVVQKFGDRIFEVHISNNDEIRDLHNRIDSKSWQIKALRYFKNTEGKFGKTKFTIESRGMSISQIKYDKKLIENIVNKF